MTDESQGIWKKQLDDVLKEKVSHAGQIGQVSQELYILRDPIAKIRCKTHTPSLTSQYCLLRVQIIAPRVTSWELYC